MENLHEDRKRQDGERLGKIWGNQARYWEIRQDMGKSGKIWGNQAR